MTQRISQFCSEFERKQEQLQTDVFLQLEIRTQVKLCLTFPGPCPGLFPGLFPGPFTGPFLTELDFQLRTDQQTDRKQKSALIKLSSVTFKVFPAPELIQTVSPGKKALQPVWFFFTFLSFLVRLLQLCRSVLLHILQLLFCLVVLWKGSTLQNKPVAPFPRDSVVIELLWESITRSHQEICLKTPTGDCVFTGGCFTTRNTAPRTKSSLKVPPSDS